MENQYQVLSTQKGKIVISTDNIKPGDTFYDVNLKDFFTNQDQNNSMKRNLFPECYLVVATIGWSFDLDLPMIKLDDYEDQFFLAENSLNKKASDLTTPLEKATYYRGYLDALDDINLQDLKFSLQQVYDLLEKIHSMPNNQLEVFEDNKNKLQADLFVEAYTPEYIKLQTETELDDNTPRKDILNMEWKDDYSRLKTERINNQLIAFIKK